MKKMNINKASDLKSFSVFLPNFVRSAEPQASQPLRSQQSQQSFSQGPSSSSQRGYGFSQMTQSSLEEQRISSQEREFRNETSKARISNEGIEVRQPLMYFSPTNYPKSINMSGKCYIHQAVDKLKRHLQEDEILWFREHPQFKHFFHMQTQPNHLWMPIWMLLLRTARLEKKKECWFIVNGVPIRYSLREFALISGLYCHSLPNNYREDLQDLRFVEKHFGKSTGVTNADVEKKLMSMKEPSRDRLQMAVLYFLSNVLIGKPGAKKYASCVEEFFLSAVNDLELCKTFPWGRMAFEENMSDIFHMMDHYKGSVEGRSRWIFPSFITPLEFLAYETIPILMRNCREKVRDAKPECPRMCKTDIKSSRNKGFPLSEVYDTLGETKDIQSIMVPDAHEESLLREIMDQEEDTSVDLDVVSGTWTRCLIEERKPIWFEQLYNEDIGTRGSKGNVGETTTYATDAYLLERVDMLEKEIKEKDEKFAAMYHAMDTRLKSMEQKSKIAGSAGQSSAQPTPATTSTTSSAKPAAPSTTQSTAVPASPIPAQVQPPAQTDTYGQAASTLVSGSSLEQMVQQIMEMGGGSWDKETVTRALRAAYNNPERAVDYLYSGIPETAEVAVPVPADQLAGSGASPVAPASGGPNSSPLDLFPQETGAAGGSGDFGILQFLRNNDQFQQLRTMVHSNPQIMQPILQELGKQNPQLLRLIQENQAEFLQLVNEPYEGTEWDADMFDQTEQEMPHAINVTPAEQEAIQRLEAMGFDRALVIEAFLACDRNKELAASYLLENSADFED